MNQPPIPIGSDMFDPASRTRDQRVLTFIITLAVLNLPFLVLGVLDLDQSPWALIRAVVAYMYYGVYYLLWRTGQGVLGTYGCIGLLTVLIAFAMHDNGGFLTALMTLYFLLLVGAGVVLNSVRALDITLSLCLMGYGGVIFYSLQVEPPPVFAQLYTAQNRMPVLSISVATLIALIGTWLVMRGSVVALGRSTAALENARVEAESRARENATLAAQVQASNQSLLTAQERLRATVAALSLPLIPLEEGIVLLPLVGYLDQGRAAQFVDGLLQGIHNQRVRVVVIDITGLREVDAQTARTLLKASQSARLLGAQVILSGVGAGAARALVNLEEDLSELRTAGRVSDALNAALFENRSHTPEQRPVIPARPETLRRFTNGHAER
jgi:anti-anti-sigma regulatory factor